MLDSVVFGSTASVSAVNYDVVCISINSPMIVFWSLLSKVL